MGGSVTLLWAFCFIKFSRRWLAAVLVFGSVVIGLDSNQESITLLIEHQWWSMVLFQKLQSLEAMRIT
ncbi:hypothetical protein A2U01_0068284 [Trifolium medium]|uniref:Uncharacterized protein n=1 Tax=Trifolium medium TaxID=97028 RepID=A0A392SDM1_9FABA|nr:hypothetical protein [Trifolium medium]